MDDLNNLILRAQRGDKDAYGELYNIFYRRIYRYCFVNVKDVEQSQDICQETFIKAWRSLPSFTLSKGGSFQAYLFRIARNMIIDLSRKRKDVSIEEIAEIESKDNLEKELDKESDLKMIHNALDKLEDTDKQILVLRFFEEMTFEEIAGVTGLNEGALRVRVHRILKKLKAIIES